MRIDISLRRTACLFLLCVLAYTQRLRYSFLKLLAALQLQTHGEGTWHASFTNSVTMQRADEVYGFGAHAFHLRARR